jgi:hypothetical protein
MFMHVAYELYKTLRAAEVFPGVKGIVVACKKFLRESELSAEGDALQEQSDLAVAIMDKVALANYRFLCFCFLRIAKVFRATEGLQVLLTQ